MTKPARQADPRGRQADRPAKRPVLYVGGGVIKAGATAELKVLAELTGAPVTTTLMGLGAFPDSHPLHVGMPGMHGSVTAVTALQKADLIVALGTRFDDRVTGKLDGFTPHQQIVHADIDPAEIGKNRAADVPIVGDAREVIADLVQAVQKEHSEGHQGDYSAWWKDLSRWRETYPLGYDLPADGSLSPQQVIERIGQLAPEGTIFAAGVGQHQMWAAHFIQYEKPATWLNSGGAGTMGYAVPAAMGAKAGARRRRLGDRRRRLLPDDQPGARHLRPEQHPDQGRHHRRRRPRDGPPVKTLSTTSATPEQPVLHSGPEDINPDAKGTRVPDFVKLSEAMGCVGLRCERPEDLDKVIEEANSINDRPVVIDFIVHEDAMVWPMVAAGTSNDEIVAARDVRPDFGDNEDD
ncbi:acetolactate synthase large subunit [Streptomyces hirsutus]